MKPYGAGCPLLIRLRRHFCSSVNDVKQGSGGTITTAQIEINRVIMWHAMFDKFEPLDINAMVRAHIDILFAGRAG